VDVVTLNFEKRLNEKQFSNATVLRRAFCRFTESYNTKLFLSETTFQTRFGLLKTRKAGIIQRRRHPTCRWQAAVSG
jgi:hypothetical protein